MPAPRCARAIGAVALAMVLASGCSTSTESAVPATPSTAAVDLVCERLQGIYVYWAGAWQRDYDTRVASGQDPETARERATRSLQAPFQRAAAQEASRDGVDAQDPAVLAAVGTLASNPQDPSGYAELSAACGVALPFPGAG